MPGEKTGRKDRKHVKKSDGKAEIRRSGGTVWPGRMVIPSEARNSDQARDRHSWSQAAGVLESFCEERNDPACEIFDGRRGAAGRQVHLPPLCDVSGARRRHKRVAKLFCRRRLPQHTRLHERAWRGSKNSQRHRTRDRTRRAWTEEQLAGAGCGKFWNHHAAARWNSRRAEFLHQVDRRRFPTKAADEARDCAAARNGRGHSGSRRQLCTA